MRHGSDRITIAAAITFCLGVIMAHNVWAESAPSAARDSISDAVHAISEAESKDRRMLCKVSCTPGACSGVNSFRRDVTGHDPHKKQLAQGVGTACAAICDASKIHNCLYSFEKAFSVDPKNPDALQAAMQAVVEDNHQVKHLMCSAGVMGVKDEYENLIEALCK